MEIILLAFEVSFQLFFIMSIGYVARKLDIITIDGVMAVNKMIYWIFLPILLFCNVYQPSLYTFSNLKIVIFSVGAILVIIACSFIIIPLIEKDNAKRGVIIQAIIRGNVLYFGMPIVGKLLGEKYVGLISIVIIAIVPIINIFSVVALEKFRVADVTKSDLIIKILKNPMIIASIIGILLIIFHIEIPLGITKGLKSVSKATTPLALIILGASINFTVLRSNIKPIVYVTILKLIVIPIICITVARQFPFSRQEIVIIYATFCVPTAVASYSTAKEMDGDYELAGQMVFMSTTAAIVTLFVGTMVLKWVNIL